MDARLSSPPTQSEQRPLPQPTSPPSNQVPQETGAPSPDPYLRSGGHRVFGPPNQPPQHTPQIEPPPVGGPPKQSPQYAPQNGGPQVVGPLNQTPHGQQVGPGVSPKSQLRTGLAPASPLPVTQPDTSNTTSAASGPPPSESHPGTRASQTEHSGASNVSSSQTQKPPGHSEGNLGWKPLHVTTSVQPSTKQTSTEADQPTASGTGEFSILIGLTPGPDNGNQAEAQANVTPEGARNRNRSRGDHDPEPEESDRTKVLKPDGETVNEPLSTQISHPLHKAEVDSQTESQMQKDGPRAPKEPVGAGNQSGDKSGDESSGDHGEQHRYDDATARRQVSASVLGMFGFTQQ